MPAFNEDVVREALLNAVAHREYSNGQSVFVRQFPNRLEIISPGGFSGGVTAENIITRQHQRNQCIAEAFQRCGLVERSGQGADLMFRTCIQEGKSHPDYSQSDSYRVMLVLDGSFAIRSLSRIWTALHASATCTWHWTISSFLSRCERRAQLIRTGLAGSTILSIRALWRGSVEVEA